MTLNAGTQLGNYHNIMTSLSESLFLVQPAHLRAVADIGWKLRFFVCQKLWSGARGISEFIQYII